MNSTPETAVLDTVILGSGFAGLTAAIRLAEEGHQVACLGDGAPGASRQNFGQLHSGAVYAPVLPEVAAACWEHRARWFELLGADIQRVPGRALFTDGAEADRYTQAWSDLAIPVRRLPAAELDAHGARPAVTPKAAFALPDVSVDVHVLHARTMSRAEALGVAFGPSEPCTLTRSGTQAVLWSPSVGYRRPQTIVLAAGHRTVHLLDLLGVQHPLALQRLPFGVLEHHQHNLPLTYWLDGDLLAVSPQPGSLHIALPGRPVEPVDEDMERYRLASALSRRWTGLPAQKLGLAWGQVAEPTGSQPDPGAVVVDLADPPPGWGHLDNLIVCLPGKWTTAWQAADQAAALRG